MDDRELLLERLELLAIVLDGLMPRCAELVRDSIALLKEQEKKKFFVDSDGKITPLPVPDVVLCKDCKHFNDMKCSYPERGTCDLWHMMHWGEWFCADGIRKESR